MVFAIEFGGIPMIDDETGGPIEGFEESSKSAFFANPQAFAGLLLGLENATLVKLVGTAGAHRVRQGKVALCDLVIGALQLGCSPLRLFDSVDIL
jgi:hypothetical protein